jgi:Protein  of unknown function (DUF3018)
MSQPKKPPPSEEERRAARREREWRHRERMRARGLRRVTTWVIDTRDPKFVEECRRWSRAVSANEQELRWFQPWSDGQDFPDWKA